MTARRRGFGSQVAHPARTLTVAPTMRQPVQPLKATAGPVCFASRRYSLRFSLYASLYFTFSHDGFVADVGMTAGVLDCVVTIGVLESSNFGMTRLRAAELFGYPLPGFLGAQR